ncbi:MAG: hypothetical protein KJO06_06460, partial [Gemmatimonadetes bacterium]|nr:hypothetical protein [Gemmatimonadota bacterium]
MSKRMMKGSGALLCLTVLLLPGRAIGQDEDQETRQLYAEQMYAQAVALSAQEAAAAAQYDVSAEEVSRLAYQAAAMADTIYRAAR